MQFFTYFKALVRAPRPKSQPIALFIAGYFIFFLGIYLANMASWFAFLAALIFAAGLTVSYYCESKPNMEAAFPVNHNKKLLYRFLSPVLLFLLMVASILAVIFIVFLIAIIVTSALDGGFGWVNDPDFAEQTGIVIGRVFGSMGVYGGLFGTAYFIIMYSAGMITGFIKKRKIRNIYLACVCAAAVLGGFFMTIPYITVHKTIIGAAPFLQSCYEAMSLPWLSIVFWLLIAAGALGGAIYLGIRYYNPKKF